MGPNFVVFLGQKYGYRPIPTYILSSELLLLRDELTALNVDGNLLDLWYKKDSNAVPPISVLQPISSILVNFNNKVCLLKFLCHNYSSRGNFHFSNRESLNCKQKIKAFGGTHWIKCRKFFEKLQLHWVQMGKLTKIKCTIISCQVISIFCLFEIRIHCIHVNNIHILTNSDGERSHKWHFECEEYEEPLLGLRALHQQYQFAKFEESIAVRWHNQSQFGHWSCQIVGQFTRWAFTQ